MTNIPKSVLEEIYRHARDEFPERVLRMADGTQKRR